MVKPQLPVGMAGLGTIRTDRGMTLKLFIKPWLISLILFTLLSLFLQGCRQEGNVAVTTDTSVSLRPTLTKTAVPTATPSPTIVLQETAVVMATSSSPLAEVTDLTTLPEISVDETATYKL